ncbi:unnamed protein product [Miscanthus lutarioriparius]|uniref:Uncharacterized protein n=1 Tax=Miscanthus lutarioriparius TaxID=422564 RepID=A0A811Q591_9POAL|nr:unnamed protein product [Miscanthus lutarioriparius]
MSMHGTWSRGHAPKKISRRPALPARLQININSGWLLSEETVGSPSRKSAVPVPVLVAHSPRRKISIGNGYGVVDGTGRAGRRLRRGAGSCMVCPGEMTSVRECVIVTAKNNVRDYLWLGLSSSPFLLLHCVHLLPGEFMCL